MRIEKRRAIQTDWDTIILLSYYTIIFVTLYTAPYWWAIFTKVFASPAFLFADVLTFAIFGAFLICLVYQDVFEKSMSDVLRYLALFAVGVLIFTTLKGLSNPFERLCIPQYALVCYVVFRIASRYSPTKAAYVWTFLAVTAFACMEETIQFFIPNRHFDIGDIFIDMWSGTLTLLVIGLAVKPRLKESVHTRFFREIFFIFYLKRRNIWLNIKDFWFSIEARVTDFLIS